MAYVKRIVCLANSYKTGGFCVAGREVLANGYGGWIRPVSARPTSEVWPSESRYENDASPKLLDTIDVPLLNPSPQHHQTENHVIDTTRRWAKKDALPWKKLENILDRPKSLWSNGEHTKYGGLNNCVSPQFAATFTDSLVLIRPGDFVVEIGTRTWEGETKRTYYGNFTYNGTNHSLSLTDPSARSAFGAKSEGNYPLKDVYLCISLTELFEKDGRCHKLVAAIFSNPPL